MFNDRMNVCMNESSQHRTPENVYRCRSPNALWSKDALKNKSSFVAPK